MGKEELINPEILNPKTQSEKNRIEQLKSSQGIDIVDEIEAIIEELYFTHFPTKKFLNLPTSESINQALKYFRIEDLQNYGNWVFYPWNKKLVHLPEEKDFETLRTTRNRELINEEEQIKLFDLKVGVLGLSVGNSIALSLIYTGIAHEIKLADPDTLSLSNLNRIRAGVADLGMNKAVLGARQILETNPYAKVTVYNEGVNETNLEDFFAGIDLVIEETDDFGLKLNSRRFAKKKRIPLVMITDNAEEIIIDVERYDLDKDYPFFHGLAGNIEDIDLKNINREQRIELATKIVGKENITPRMQESLKEVGKSLVSWPQLATTVFAGGGIGAYVVKQIALGRKISSKRFKIDIDKNLLDT